MVDTPASMALVSDCATNSNDKLWRGGKWIENGIRTDLESNEEREEQDNRSVPSS